MVTFVPPTLADYFPRWVLYAIGFAGLAATVFAAFVPALMVRASRKRFGSPHLSGYGVGMRWSCLFFSVRAVVCRLPYFSHARLIANLWSSLTGLFQVGYCKEGNPVSKSRTLLLGQLLFIRHQLHFKTL